MIIQSCDDGGSGDPSGDKFARFVYYSADEAKSPDPGLFEYNLTKETERKIIERSIAATSGVAENGNILIGYGTGFVDELALRTWDGLIKQIPMPESTEDYVYELLDDPLPQLSADGDKAAFFVVRNLKGDPDPLTGRPFLALYDCETEQMSLIPIYDQAIEMFEGLGANVLDPTGEYLILNRDGSKIFFVLNASTYNGTSKIDRGFKIFVWGDGGLQTASSLHLYRISLAGMNMQTERALATIGDTLYTVYTYDELRLHALGPNNLSNPNQFAKVGDEMVVWTDWGIEIVYADQGNLIRRVISFEDLEEAFPGLVYGRSSNLSFSPDHEYIVFGFFRQDSRSRQDLIVCNREGGELKKIVENGAFGIPVLSNLMQVEE